MKFCIFGHKSITRLLKTKSIQQFLLGISWLQMHFWLLTCYCFLFIFQWWWVGDYRTPLQQCFQWPEPSTVLCPAVLFCIPGACIRDAKAIWRTVRPTEAYAGNCSFISLWRNVHASVISISFQCISYLSELGGKKRVLDVLHLNNQETSRYLNIAFCLYFLLTSISCWLRR